MTHDDGLTDDERRLERRRSRLGVLGVALFVGGPVLGAALVVVGVIVALREDPRWVLVVAAGLAVAFGLTFAGLRLLTRIERARSDGAAPSDHGTPSRDVSTREPTEPADPATDRDARPGAAPDQPDSASPGRTRPDS
ncbi:hypothetical protein [Agromyces sp. SYSU T00266]|uniref:hypothetical protein n=1 Tax=Agromyces zhanjiangensis TaxID=3158562 RepID=UPI00339ADC91